MQFVEHILRRSEQLCVGLGFAAGALTGRREDLGECQGAAFDKGDDQADLTAGRHHLPSPLRMHAAPQMQTAAP